MPTKRQRKTHLTLSRVTPAAVTLFRLGDWIGLHRELGLRPWEVSPLDASGACAHSMGLASWPKAAALREELLHAD